MDKAPSVGTCGMFMEGCIFGIVADSSMPLRHCYSMYVWYSLHEVCIPKVLNLVLFMASIGLQLMTFSIFSFILHNYVY